MSHGSHKHAAQPPFVDFHCNVAGDVARIEGVLPISAIEGLAVGLYVDASQSFQDEYGQGGIARLLGLGSANQVDEALKPIVPYLAGMDASRALRMAYWAGGDGRRVYPLSNTEVTAAEAAAMTFDGPPSSDFGSGTFLLPALRDFVDHIRGLVAAGETVAKGLMVVITDGAFHDYDQVLAYAQDMEQAISEGKLPRIVVSIVGVGDQVSEDQLEQLLHDTRLTDADEATFCYNLVTEMPGLAAMVAHLVDVDVVAFTGGATITDSDGQVLMSYEDEVPALIELEVPVASGHIVFSAGGKTWEIEIDEEDDHEGGHHDDHDEPAMAGAAADDHHDH